MSLPTVAELMRAAELETALDDWALDHVGTPERLLTTFVDDLNRTSSLHARGEERFYRFLMDILTSRLKYVADRKRHAGWREEKLEAPIFILGLPRSGTTFLHNLMGADPASRAPRLFEMHYPSPRADDPLARGLREKKCEERLRDLGLLDEDWLGVHPMGADRAEECLFFWELLLASATFTALAELPTYQDVLFQQDFRAIYREQRDFLKYLQHGLSPRRWVLKTPLHVRFLEEIIEVFPDAMFVHCHRDTAKTYPSIANMAAVLRSKFAPLAPSAKSIVGDYDDTWEKALEFRRRPGMAERFVDVRFLDFRADPIGTVRSIYDRLGLDFSDDRAAAMEAWLASDATERSGRTHHQYSLADIGMTEGDIDRLTGDYLSAFDVPLERQGTV